MIRRVWCLSCAREATFVDDSMVPAYPIVICRYEVQGANGTLVRGCGRLPGTWDQAEAERTAAEVRQVKLGKAHHQGRHSGHAVRGCELCAPAFDHRQHVRDRRPMEGCAQCRVALRRCAPERSRQ